MNMPVIGFTLDYEKKQTYSKLPWYAIRENYMELASHNGAIPIGLPHELNLIGQYLDLIYGLVVIGGDFDIPPHLYGETEIHKTVTTKDRRTDFEWKMVQGAIDRNIPILGICGGQQLLATVLGGTLIQHIPDEIKSDIQHEQPNPRNEVGHTVTVKEGSLLHQIVGQSEIGVNSAHHQAVKSVGKNCIISAHAPDGIIEAIEYPAHPFCLGVQWHPEYRVTEADDKINAAFITACKAHKS